MRLRQVALASRDLDAVTARLAELFGLEVAYRDPHIVHYGLRNAVLPAGTAFLEAVEPVRADASAGRFLDRRGGDAGYMLILQVGDAAAERARVERLGARVVDEIDRPDYLAFHFHPADFGGVLVSFDQQRTTGDPLEPWGDWFPAGPDWRAHSTGAVQGVNSVTLSAPNPAALARRWGELLDRPVSDGVIALDGAEIRFAPGGPGTSIAALGVQVSDPEAVRARLGGADATIGGVRFEIA